MFIWELGRGPTKSRKETTTVMRNYGVLRINSSLQQIDTITENQNWSKCREQLIMGYPTPTDTSTTQLQNLQLRAQQKRG